MQFHTLIAKAYLSSIIYVGLCMLRCEITEMCALTLTSLGFQYIYSIILGNNCEHKLDL